MIRYIKINWVLIKNSLIRDSQLPGYIISQMLYRLLEIVISLIFFNVIFSSVSSLAGWNYWQVIFLYALSRTINIIHSGWTRGGLKQFAGELIRRGEFDFYLAKPVDPMIMVSIYNPRIYNLTTLFFMIPLGVYAAFQSGMPIGFINIFWFFVLALLGLIIYYFLSVLTVIPAFWFVRLWAMTEIMNRLNTFMRYPAGIFAEGVKIALLVIFPIMAASYLPASVLFYPPQAKYIIFMFSITIILGLITRYIWYLGQKSYNSASS